MTCLHVDERQERLDNHEAPLNTDNKDHRTQIPEKVSHNDPQYDTPTTQFTIGTARNLFQSVLRVVVEIIAYGTQAALVAVVWLTNLALSTRRTNPRETRQKNAWIKPEHGHAPSLISPKTEVNSFGSEPHGQSEFHHRTIAENTSLGKRLVEKRQRESPLTSEGGTDAPTKMSPLEGGAEYAPDGGGPVNGELELQLVLSSPQGMARHGRRASYKSQDPELANKLDQTHRSSLPSPTMFALAETTPPRHHLRISNEETPMSDGGDQEAAQILVSLQSATNVSTNLQSTPTPDPLTFLLDLPPSLTHQTTLPLSPLSLAMLAYHDQEIPSTPPHFVRTETTRERTTRSFTVPRAPYPSPSFHPLLPRRDTPFPYFDPGQRVQTQRLQLGVLEARSKGAAAEISAPVQPTLEDEGEDEGKQFSNESRRSHLTIMAEESLMDVDEAPEPTEALQVEEEQSSLQPTRPALVATTANTESVNAAIAELGLPATRPPTHQTRFNAATYTILRHYLPDDPHLQAMAEKIIEFQARTPEAERLALLRDVLAAFLKQIIRRVEEEQARAQEALGDDVVHGWVMLLEALHWSHERLADETGAALEKVLEIASELQKPSTKSTSARVAAYQSRLAASGRALRNASTPSPERESATLGSTLPETTNEPPEAARYSPVNEQGAMHGMFWTIVSSARKDVTNDGKGWDFLAEEAPLRSPEEERELARELASMQFGPEELSREEMMPTILAPLPSYPPSTASRLEASVNPNDTVGSSSLASFDFPIEGRTSWEATSEGTAHGNSEKATSNAFTDSPTQVVVTVVYAAWPQGSTSSALDVVRVVNTATFGFETATTAHHAAHEICPPTPIVHRQPAATFTAVTRGPEQWERPSVAFADNNPCYPHFRPRPGQPYDPLLPFEEYAKKGAFLRAPMNRIAEHSSDGTMNWQWLVACRQSVREAVVFSALRSALYQACNPYALGLLLDHDSIGAPNGYRLAYLYDYNEKPIYVDPTKEDIELKQIIFLLHPFERALGEILWSQMAELGYHDQANDWASFLNTRYVCDNVLEDLLEMGWLDIDAEVGEEGLWTQQLPNLVFDDHSSFTAASVPPDEERKQLFREGDVQLNEAETGSSSDDLSYFSQEDDDDDSIICSSSTPEPPLQSLRRPQRWPQSLIMHEPLHIYVANPSGSVHPPPSTNEQQVPFNTPTGDTEHDHIAESFDEYEDVTDGEGLVEMDVREEDDGWYDYASDGGSWA
ncbi:hypothetical protein C8F01DRAFT_1095618 [Mycena amicta]|nr:hypothetical protein C8F01DRAFT_1095618 [Mycena amicta]